LATRWTARGRREHRETVRSSVRYPAQPRSSGFRDNLRLDRRPVTVSWHPSSFHYAGISRVERPVYVRPVAVQPRWVPAPVKLPTIERAPRAPLSAPVRRGAVTVPALSEPLTPRRAAGVLSLSPQRAAVVRPAKAHLNSVQSTVQTPVRGTAPKSSAVVHDLHSSLTRASDAVTCKERPRRSLRGGGSGSRAYVPWCDRRS
jgi:hypothetical protein